ncbi:MAG: hypothetical protein A2087_14485 [Spirochaetes bacterium GWD1_61_31]|nr:MAG: hypothetical protein A2Y37_11055 [Spirochaetes bacterium GWB1_60_80]OHD35318.1 MAG: hypothetical protein A2004_00290 [Spirochaetes bacterium GWC1_61_12]OHD37295.1 MAG: hypothetical protein A2087_14485 [Spirochaetes bacterium GWD1_61_31]OHD44974.1 MAG: hypothetical protein A2Y35_13100 [Spirochaetes bacterium GWE1_60_18]OHD60083.1 MAG: hypothetical protein A2Y32_11210 [Spirochaetes bacterium GWF1_60_12]HAP43649.1 hypothetical protein [Spirochaetaceae bacterium]
MNRKFSFLALLCVSVSSIAYELYVMRIFSIGGWSNFGALVISSALLGIGLSGIILTFISDWVNRNADAILLVSAASLPFLMALATIVAQMVPFNPVFLAADGRQLWFIGAFFVIYGVPFFVSATFVGVCFIKLRDAIQQLYFWNMIGSGLGGLVIIICMYLFPPRLLLVPIMVIAACGAILASATHDDISGKSGFRRLPLFGVLGAFVLALGLALNWGAIRISEFKAISYVRKYPDAKLVHHSYGPGGEYHVYASKYFHFAPGLSDNAGLNIENLPTQPFWGLYIDGSGPIGIMGQLRDDERAYLDYLPMAAPYTILERPDAFFVNLNGGLSAHMARYKNANSITIAEPSDELLHILTTDANLLRFTGNLLVSPDINVHNGDPRAYSVSHPAAFDLVEISLTDSIGLSDSGGYAVHEDYRYTVEAFKEYFTSLRDGGILSLTIWDRLNPPRNVLRLLNTINIAMEEAGFAAPAESLYSFGLFLSTSTILVKKGSFAVEEVQTLDRFVRSRSFETLYSPAGVQGVRDIDVLLSAYQAHFSMDESQEFEQFTNGDMYRAFIPELFLGNGPYLEQEFVFDIRPIRDSRPYYSGFLKLGMLPTYLRQLPHISEEWGYLMQLGVLLQASLFALLVILIPVIGRWKSLFKNRKGTGTVIAYFAALGLSYMLIELFLIQRLGAFLSNPTYSASIVITLMLIMSATGSIVSTRFKRVRQWVVPVACLIICAGLFFYIFGLNPFLANFRAASLAVRILISALIIAPVAFFMGMPYPNGLDALQESRPHLLPWAWGMNGGLSVVGATLARIISVNNGFPVLLIFAILLYAGIGILFQLLARAKDGKLDVAETEGPAARPDTAASLAVLGKRAKAGQRH